jgi:hypothetical protein
MCNISGTQVALLKSLDELAEDEDLLSGQCRVLQRDIEALAQRRHILLRQRSMLIDELHKLQEVMLR